MNVGDRVKLENAKLYSAYCSKVADEKISGEYFIYKETIKNNRIRITDDISRVNIPHACTGWVNVTDCK